MGKKAYRGVLHSSKGGVYVSIHLIPGSSRDEIKGVNPWRNCLEVAVTEEPVDGAANAALVYLISKLLEVSSGKVNIVKGKTVRKKRLFIKGVSHSDVLRGLNLEDKG